MSRTVAACLATGAAAAALLGPAAAQGGPPARYERSTVLVRFAAPAAASRLVARLGDTVAGTTRTGVTVVRLHRGRAVPAAVAQYRKLPGVRYAEPNFLAHAFLASPNDSSFSQQWALQKVQAPTAWGVYPGSYAAGRGVRVAVVDTGIDALHSDLDDGRVRTDLSGNCLSGTGCTAGAAADDNGHGTHVAGIVAAETNNGVGVAGLAYTSELLAVKVLDATATGSYAAIADGIDFAVDHGARVVNLSIGGTDASQTLCDEVAAAVARGAVVVAAAGNDATSAPHYPAACRGALGVSATTSSDRLASFSDYGSANNVMVSAPGDQVLSTYRGNTYRTMSGTSMAAPLVTALAALLLGEAPGRSVTDVERVLATTSDKIGGGYGTDPYGTCSGCTWSSSYGYGRINAYRALAQTPPQPDFGLTADPAVVTGPLGGAGVVRVGVQSFNGFSGPVSLAATGVPPGALAAFLPSTVSAPGEAQLVVTVPPTVPSGRYVVTVTGTSGALTRTTTLALDVTGVGVSGASGGGSPGPGTSVGPPDFTFDVIPAVRAVTRGSATAYLLRATPSGTFTGPIVVSVAGLPAGAVAPPPPPLTAPGEGALAIATLPSTPPGTYTLTLTASAGSIVHTATATLVVS